MSQSGKSVKNNSEPTFSSKCNSNRDQYFQPFARHILLTPRPKSDEQTTKSRYTIFVI